MHCACPCWLLKALALTRPCTAGSGRARWRAFCKDCVRLSRMPCVKRERLTRALVTTMRSVFSTSSQRATSARAARVGQALWGL